MVNIESQIYSSAKGGIGNTYEVIDERKIPKVLKVLTYDSSKAIDLFRRKPIF